MADSDLQTLSHRIQRSLDDLPPLSPTVAKVLQLVGSPDASANELIQVIKMDPVLTAKVLRLINSPWFGLENVTSVARALVVLGFNTVKNLALSSALSGLLTQGADDAGNELWTHSLGVGVAARAIARAMGIPREDQEAAFIGGLMHDLGRVLITKYFQPEMKRSLALQASGLAELEAEEQVFGTTHEVIGGMLGRKWQFPASLLVSVEYHHRPILKGLGARESSLTCLANGMYYRKGLGSIPKHEIPPLPPAIWTVLNLTQEQIDEAMEQVPEELESAKLFLGR